MQEQLAIFKHRSKFLLGSLLQRCHCSWPVAGQLPAMMVRPRCIHTCLAEEMKAAGRSWFSNVARTFPISKLLLLPAVQLSASVLPHCLPNQQLWRLTLRNIKRPLVVIMPKQLLWRSCPNAEKEHLMRSARNMALTIGSGVKVGAVRRAAAVGFASCGLVR